MSRQNVAQAHQQKFIAPSTGGLLQRKCACGNHTVAGGRCTEGAKKKTSFQRKLAVGASHDPIKNEADQIAEQVMAGPVASYVNPVPPSVQRFTGHTAEQTDLAPASVERVLASSGRPLEPALRQDMEHRFGQDFSRVRVHTGTAAEKSARDVNAHAYTIGQDVVFRAGRFAPQTQAGQRLLAHELAHVAEQRPGAAIPRVMRTADPTEQALYPSVSERGRVRDILDPQQQAAAATGTAVPPVTDPGGFRTAMAAV